MLSELSSHAADFGFGVLFFFFFAAALGIPLPASVALVLGGAILASNDALGGLVALVAAAALAGTLLGDTVWFYMGRRIGPKALRLLCRISLSRDVCVRQTEEFFERQGVKVLLFARFVPGLSYLAVPMAGAAAVKFPRFVLFDAAGVVAWIVCGLGLGALTSRQIDWTLVMLREAGLGVTGLVAGCLIAYVAIRWLRHHAEERKARGHRMTAQQLRDLLASGRALTIIDVRSGIHRKLDPVAIPGAHLMRLDHLPQETAAFARREEIVTYCSCPNDATAVRAGEVLRVNGFTNVHVLQGGIDAWRNAGYGVESIAPSERESEQGREAYPS